MMDHKFKDSRVVKLEYPDIRNKTATINFRNIPIEEDESSHSEEEDVAYKNINKVGRLRNLYSNLIAVEEVPYKPKKKRNISLTLDFPRVYEKESFETIQKNFQEQISEALTVKTKLAQRGIKIPLKELEEGLINLAGRPSKPEDFPKGGETLITNPFQVIKEISKKKKKRSRG